MSQRCSTRSEGAESGVDVVDMVKIVDVVSLQVAVAWSHRLPTILSLQHVEILVINEVIRLPAFNNL